MTPKPFSHHRFLLLAQNRISTATNSIHSTITTTTTTTRTHGTTHNHSKITQWGTCYSPLMMKHSTISTRSFHSTSQPLYSRKFEKIKGKKMVADVRRMVIQSKISREIQSAVSQSKNPDPETNYRLKLAIDNAKRNHVTKATVEKAIQSGLSEKSADMLELVWYAGRVSRVCVMVKALAHRSKRQVTTNYLKHIFTSNGGSVGDPKSVEFAFQKKGMFVFPQSTNLDDVLDDCIESNAEDVFENHEGNVVCLCDPNDYFSVKAALEERGHKEFQDSDVVMYPLEASLELVDQSSDLGQQIDNLLQELNDHEDVQNVYCNVRWEGENNEDED